MIAGVRALFAAVLVTAATLLSGGAGLAQSATPPASALPGAAVLQPGPFTLHRLDGAALDGVELDGKPYGLFFGFTHCPDVCPTTLAELSLAFAAMGEKAPDLPVYFVAADADRDTPEALAAFLGAFDKRIVGLRGSAEEIATAAQAFGAVARRRELPGGGYTVEAALPLATLGLKPAD